MSRSMHGTCALCLNPVLLIASEPRNNKTVLLLMSNIGIIILDSFGVLKHIVESELDHHTLVVGLRAGSFWHVGS